MLKVGICSLGCKVNIYESEYVTNLLKENNFQIVDFNEKADIYIINTCTVTNESDKKSRKMINHAKKNNELALIVVMGCYSQINPNDIDADIVIGNKDKSKIVDLINEAIEKKEKIVKSYDLRKEKFEIMEIHDFENHTRAFVKIQDGCNAFCSYCIIPYARGAIRSKPFDLVIKEVENLVKKGYKEIVLTGIHTGKYGIDINSSLEELLRRLIQIPNLYRLRLSSIEINEITDGILDLMKNSDILANHLHIPLQSGSDKILKLMNRRYDLAYFKDKVNKIRKVREDISLTTDLIVGFPYENEEDFKETLKTLEEIAFTKIHVFPYSKRKNTVASKMDMQVDSNIKKRRVREVLELSSRYEKAYYEKYINKELEVITELKQDGKILSHTSNFIPIHLSGNIPGNEIVKVKIDEIVDNKVFGHVLDTVDIM